MYKRQEESVSNTPDRIAIVYGSQQLSYEVLNTRANKLAHYLIEQGVTIETPVAVSLNRSPELIVTLLAILKAGGTYIPLDPEYPSERLEYMLSDSAAKFLLTSQEISKKCNFDRLLKESKNIVSNAIVCIDDILDSSIQTSIIKSYSSDNPNISIPLESLCYIIYTSGSTGKPKGVGTIHKNVVNLATVSYTHLTLPTSDLV